jgi:hypothetical protein
VLPHIKKKKMTREEHLKFCKVCINRKMDMQQGLICSITSERADFENNCENYIIDEIEKEKLESKSNEESTKNKDSGFFGSWKSALLLSAFSFIRTALKGFDDIFGIIFFLLGIGWLIIALVGNNKK